MDETKSHRVTLGLPDAIDLPLLRKAEEAGRPLEALARDCLARAVQDSPPTGRLRRWAGAFASDGPDAATGHREFLGRAFEDELQGRPDERAVRDCLAGPARAQGVRSCRLTAGLQYFRRPRSISSSST